MRLIDADTLKAEFTGNFNEMWHYTGIRAVIDVAPTIDAEPVRHGNWTDEKVIMHSWYAEYQYKCSVCGNRTITRNVLPRYCDSCGAKMDEVTG